MNVRKIFGTIGCHKCQTAKKKHPEALYMDLSSLSSTEYEMLIDKARMANQSSMPIILDEHDNIIEHHIAGV